LALTQASFPVPDEKYTRQEFCRLQLVNGPPIADQQPTRGPVSLKISAVNSGYRIRRGSRIRDRWIAPSIIINDAKPERTRMKNDENKVRSRAAICDLHPGRDAVPRLRRLSLKYAPFGEQTRWQKKTEKHD